MTPEDRISLIENKVQLLEKKLKENTGGVLSGVDIRTRIICKEEQDKYLNMFEKRDWEGIKKTSWETTANIGDNKPEATKRFVIKEYDELNVTPFSYDLSLGDQFFSIQRPQKGVIKRNEGQAYDLESKETIIVITKEKIAIPHAYSATVWPRFNMVKQGVFQSMVKIDPTWYGHLAIAMSNLSPATVKLKVGKAFATLLLYELTSASDVDLWKMDEIKDIAVGEQIPIAFRWNSAFIECYIKSSGIRDTCWMQDDKLMVRGIKRQEVNILKKCFNDPVWRDFIDNVADQWVKKVHSNGNKIIVMPTLGMTSFNEMLNLDKTDEIVNIGFLSEKDVRGGTCTEDECINMAIQYGKPFDIVAKIPNTILERFENESIPRVETEIESKIQVRVVLLVFSMLGLLSLGVAAARMLLDKGETINDAFFRNSAYICSTLGIITALGFLGLIFVGQVSKRRIENRVWKETKQLHIKEQSMRQWIESEKREMTNMKDQLESMGKNLQLLTQKSEKRTERLLKKIKVARQKSKV